MNKNKYPNSRFDILGKDAVWPGVALISAIAVAGAYQAVPGGGKDVAPIRPSETQAPTHEAVSSPVVFPTQEAQGIYGQFNPVYEQAGAAMVKGIVDSTDVLAKAGVVPGQNPDKIELSNGPTNDHVATREAGAANSVDASSASTESAVDAPASIVSGGPVETRGAAINQNNLGAPVSQTTGDTPGDLNSTQPEQTSANVDPTSTMVSIGPNGSTIPPTPESDSLTDPILPAGN